MVCWGVVGVGVRLVLLGLLGLLGFKLYGV